MNTDNNKDLEYTMVMNAGTEAPAKEAADTADKAIERIRTVKEDPRKTMDGLYAAYEEMCFRDPTVLDRDDIYPHSYQWRTAERYNAAKLAVLTEAVKEGKRIADTEAYVKFVEAGKNRKFKPDSWD